MGKITLNPITELAITYTLTQRINNTSNPERLITR